MKTPSFRDPNIKQNTEKNNLGLSMIVVAQLKSFTPLEFNVLYIKKFHTFRIQCSLYQKVS